MALYNQYFLINKKRPHLKIINIYLNYIVCKKLHYPQKKCKKKDRKYYKNSQKIICNYVISGKKYTQ